ncbi:hypothetical protein HYV49_04080 [Candidatus Pacearchaeota archaeon]|nr:hypothetical protein [Candidatus Pacearchaeota archaeon]
MADTEIWHLCKEADGYFQAKQLDKAESVYRKALDLDKDKAYSSMIHFRLGLIASVMHTPEEGIAELKQSLDDMTSFNGSDDAKQQLEQLTNYNLGQMIYDSIINGNETRSLDEAEQYFKNVLAIPVNNQDLIQPAQELLDNIRYMKNRGWVIVDKEGGVRKYSPPAYS